MLNKISNCTTPSQKISTIEEFLINNLIDQSGEPNYISNSLKVFTQLNGRNSIGKTCQELLISHKSMIKNFKKYIGITPVKFIQLAIINKAIIQLSHNPNLSITDLAFNLGFYDQAHFIKSFKSFTSFTPLQYSKLVKTNHIDKDSPNFVFL